jgi:hypothetical protein
MACTTEAMKKKAVSWKNDACPFLALRKGNLRRMLGCRDQ